MNDSRLRGQVSGTLERADGAVVRWWRGGRGDPLVLVHDSFDDHNGLAGVLPVLAQHADVVTYDRRGHSLSSAPRGRVGLQQDAEDLLGLVDNVIGGPAHFVGLGYGGVVAMQAAILHRDAVRSLAVHEPPAFGVLQDNPMAKVLLAELSVWLEHAAGLVRSGDPAGGARIFAEKVSVGKGSWYTLFNRERRATMVSNALVWLDQHLARGANSLDITPLAWARFPVTQFVGDHSLQLHELVADALTERLPFIRTINLAGIGHAPNITHPEDLAQAIVGHLHVG